MNFRVCLLITLVFLTRGYSAVYGHQTFVGEDPLLAKAVAGKDFRTASGIACEIGRQLYIDKKNAEARKMLDLAATYALKTADPQLEIEPARLSGRICFEAKEFKKAIEYFSKCGAAAAKAGNTAALFESLVMTSQCHASNKRYRKAIDSAEEALSVALKDKQIPGQVTCYKMLEEYHLSNGDKARAEDNRIRREAIILLQQREEAASARARDMQLVYNNEKVTTERKLNEQQVLLDEEHEKVKMVENELRLAEEVKAKKQLEIDLLSKDRQLANLRIQEQNSRIKTETLFRNSILVVLLLVSVLIGVIIVNYRKQVKTSGKIELQNKNIRSSINYAKRIQESMLPEKEVQARYLPDSFILFKPRDVVSGDFYWISPVNASEPEGDLAFAAMDCTGHGVPGAFMSMVGINSLNTILARGITHANEIIGELHRQVRTSLRQEVTGNNDGMDAALCIYRKSRNTLEFAGAKNPLVYITNNELFQVKGDIHSLGGSRSKNDQQYRKHEIPITAPTMVYLFTDGYRDQFGGPENQKFMSKRFSKLLLSIHHLPLDEQSEVLSSEFEKWKGGNEQTDDVLVMGVRLGLS